MNAKTSKRISLQDARPNPNKKHGVERMCLRELAHIATTLNNGQVAGRQATLARYVGVSDHGVVCRWFDNPGNIGGPVVRQLRVLYLAATQAWDEPPSLHMLLQGGAEAISLPPDAL